MTINPTERPSISHPGGGSPAIIAREADPEIEFELILDAQSNPKQTITLRLLESAEHDVPTHTIEQTDSEDSEANLFPNQTSGTGFLLKLPKLTPTQQTNDYQVESIDPQSEPIVGIINQTHVIYAPTNDGNSSAIPTTTERAATVVGIERPTAAGPTRRSSVSAGEHPQTPHADTNELVQRVDLPKDAVRTIIRDNQVIPRQQSLDPIQPPQTVTHANSGSRPQTIDRPIMEPNTSLDDFEFNAAPIARTSSFQAKLPYALPATHISHPAPSSVAQITSQIMSSLSASAKDTVELRLDPPELGRVVISITQTDSNMSATISAEKPEVFELLRRNADLLSRELSKSGLDGVSMQFESRDSKSDGRRFPINALEDFEDISASTDTETAIGNVVQLTQNGLDIRL